MTFISNYIEKRCFKTLDNLQFGMLRVTTPEGKVHTFVGKQSGPEAAITLHTWKTVKNVLMRGDIALGEDYIAGLWETDDLETLFSLFIMNLNSLDGFVEGDWFRRLCFLAYNRFVRRNSKRGSKRNIAAHYDVGNDFYRLWLDDTMTYSSALYQNNGETLTDAQNNKYNRILSKFGDNISSVLEIGCGWGGFAEAAAKMSRRVTGLTISPSQHAFAKARLGDNADIQLQDYRDSKGKFDAIVSIEMFEAVGERYWPVYFKTVAERLKSGGKAIIQTITIGNESFNDYRNRSDFIRHYVFPGGMLPSQKRFKEEAAKAGLKCQEMFSFGQDYARTLREWLRRFEDRREEILSLGYSEAFIRNWRFYLSICAASFNVNHTDVMQVELSHA